MSNPSGSAKRKILVVDDSQFITAAVGKTLRENGYDVIEANNGFLAIDKARTDSPDCILLDLLMPEIDGLEVLARLKKQGMTIPVIILTADIQDTTKKRCLEAGAADFLNKPPKAEEMLSAIKRLTGE